MEQCYTLAYNLYQSGKEEDAMAVFQLLCMLDHYDSRFFLGLGACRQATENWSAALETYSFATFLDVNDPRFPFHAAECLMQLSDFDGAQSGFESARLLATGKPEYEEIKLQSETMLDVINIKREQQNERNNH
ncbi:SycD/LcrH family type III secretion system chaperone [Arsenophonus endosymbiont of Aphis craccivora]|uniref:SycD/LcrH family type III secretion system chaperone n=1 Tax=Arsenophonus endosymbiont of Aphis craccivora TaxID=1231049 RepID=UPI00271521A9|nr:SycD/LcrH family type III secretion system chaperone [Arsenophonus endosymbiont of Aphis craccivora]